jgi:hypothetical protein
MINPATVLLNLFIPLSARFPVQMVKLYNHRMFLLNLTTKVVLIWSIQYRLILDEIGKRNEILT